MPNKHTVNELVFLSKFWTVGEAMWVLWCCKSYTHQLLWKGFWTTLGSINAAVGDAAMADSVPVRFQGGPMTSDGKLTQYKTYEGSLAMFAVDRMLRMACRENDSLDWLMAFDPECPHHIKDQLKSHHPDAGGYKQKEFFGDERDGHYERDDLLSHYEGGERVTDYVQVGDSIVPILESGRQGVATKAIIDDGRVARWSSSGKVNV